MCSWLISDIMACTIVKSRSCRDHSLFHALIKIVEGVTNRICGKHNMIAVQNKKWRVVPTCPVYKVKTWNSLQRLEYSRL